MTGRLLATVLIRGTGDIASAVAVLLVRAGYRVALHDEPAPSTTRRGMAFADAVFDGSATLAGLRARRVETAAELVRVSLSGDIPVAIYPFDLVLQATSWRAIIDARMRKRAVPKRQRGSAPLTLGLGPNFIAGDTVDLAIETGWGDRLGAVIDRGSTLPLQGEPQPIGGVARARFVYAPVAGRFSTSMRIGDLVEQGKVVATIAEIPLRAPFAGVIRGLTHDGVDVAERTKVIKVDPRCDPAAAFGLGARPKRIAEGVLSALARARVLAAA
jgi:xanthine dehydrogenase accessory factor